MPLFALAWVFFTMANIGFPGTASFVGEFLVVVGLYTDHTGAALLAASGMVLGAAYALWLANRLVYGLAKPHLAALADLNRRETLTLLPLAIGVVDGRVSRPGAPAPAPCPGRHCPPRA